MPSSWICCRLCRINSCFSTFFAQLTKCRVRVASTGTKRATQKGMTMVSSTTETIPLMAQPWWSAGEMLARKTMMKKTQKPVYRSPKNQIILSWMRQLRSCLRHAGQPSCSNLLKPRTCSEDRNIPGSPQMSTEPMPMAMRRPICSHGSSETQSARALLPLTVPEAWKKTEASMSAPAMSHMKKSVRRLDGMKELCTRAAPTGFCTRKMRKTAAGSVLQ
mmetsp:Transcript_1188/g.3205  ORF Transcript_1188/g.3205 Transcript_1188/m.3205 type:complete len:219 (-) Transcript_1188:246-902(-)